MRTYTFNHFMFNGLCKGIQSTHAVQAIRHAAGQHGAVYHDWDHNHKTLIFLQGGNSASLHGVVARFVELGVKNGADAQNGFKQPMPWATFNEDEATLEGALTAVAIVVHPRYYIATAASRSNRDFWQLSDEMRAELCIQAAAFEPEAVKVSLDRETFSKFTQPEMDFINFFGAFQLAPTA